MNKVSAQILINPVLAEDATLTKDQLWNVNIVNNSSDVAILKLYVDIRDLQTGESVLNAYSNNIIANKGIKLIGLADVQPIAYNYLSNEFSGSFLPCGVYIINYRLVQETDKGLFTVADASSKVQVKPISPPVLVFPQDKSTIITPYPQFIWMAPGPTQMYNPLVYQLLLVKVKESQEVKDAIMFNPPVYEKKYITAIADQFPGSYTGLEKGGTYAWQIVATSGESCPIATEVWSFKVVDDSIANIVSNAPYVKMATTHLPVAMIHQGMLKMEYNHQSYKPEVEVKLYLVKAGSIQTPLIQFSMNANAGVNYVEKDLSKWKKLDEGQIYEVSIKDADGRLYFMRFAPKYY